MTGGAGHTAGELGQPQDTAGIFHQVDFAVCSPGLESSNAFYILHTTWVGGIFTNRAFVQLIKRCPLWTDRPAPRLLADGGWSPAVRPGLMPSGAASCVQRPCPSRLGLPYRAPRLGGFQDRNHCLPVWRLEVQGPGAAGRFLLRLSGASPLFPSRCHPSATCPFQPLSQLLDGVRLDRLCG